MGRTLVAYFSATGATRRLAERIANTVQADTFEIEPARKYTDEDLKWPSTDNRSCIEMKNKDFRPRTARKLKNINDYDTIFLGFPIWYNTAPTIINTFIEENSLFGKDVYIFVTSGAHSVDKSLNDLRKSYPYVTFMGAKRFSGTFYQREVWNWINAESEQVV